VFSSDDNVDSSSEEEEAIPLTAQRGEKEVEVRR